MSCQPQKGPSPPAPDVACSCPQTDRASKAAPDAAFRSRILPLEYRGLRLHLKCLEAEGCRPEQDILLIHGVTYSSHVFDLRYRDYSLARRLAREAYRVWLLDLAGYGQSEAISDGFLPDSDHAAEEIAAAVERIVSVSGQDRIDVLGWSWGTVTASRFASAHPEHVRRLVLYAPILCGIGEAAVAEPFHHNSWEHAADDFQRRDDGTFDLSLAEEMVIELWCSDCWHYDGDRSPNAGRRDICVSDAVSLIDLKQIRVPTLILCGSRDPYLNYERIHAAPGALPEGSALEVIDGGSHIVMAEKPYYHDFQDRLLRYLKNAQR